MNASDTKKPLNEVILRLAFQRREAQRTVGRPAGEDTYSILVDLLINKKSGMAIAKERGISQQRVSKIKNDFEVFLSEFLDKNGQ